MKKYILIICSALFLIGCQSETKVNPQEGTHREKRNAQELLGQEYLANARKYMAANEFESARAEIDSMRSNCRRALTARETGILLLDSINLREAEYNLVLLDERMKTDKDSAEVLKVRFDEMFLKAEFYRRKIEHDKNETKGL